MNGKIIRNIRIAFILIIIVIFAGAGGYYLFFEGKHSFLDCLYMTIISITTVGYGEVIPINTPLLKAYTIGLILFGAGTIFYFLSNVTAFIIEGELNIFFWRKKMESKISKLKDHYILCGLGKTGKNCARQMLADNHEIVIIESNEASIIEFKEEMHKDILYVIGDATEEEVLKKGGIKNAKGLFATLKDDHENLFLVITAKGLNPNLKIVAKVHDSRSIKKFKQVGASSVVNPAAFGAYRMVGEMIRPNITGFIDLIVRERGEKLIMEEVTISENSILCNRTLANSDLRKKTNILVIAIKGKREKEFFYYPKPDMMLKAGTTMIVLGDREAIEALKKIV